MNAVEILTTNTNVTIELFNGMNRVRAGGTFGGGTLVFELEVGGGYVPLPDPHSPSSYTQLSITSSKGFDIQGPGKIKGTLTGATSPNITLEAIQLPK